MKTPEDLLRDAADRADRDRIACTRIQELMSEQEWNTDTLDDIAGVMRTAGYTIEDTNN
jgi:hypothetical protein